MLNSCASNVSVVNIDKRLRGRVQRVAVASTSDEGAKRSLAPSSSFSTRAIVERALHAGSELLRRAGLDLELGCKTLKHESGPSEYLRTGRGWKRSVTFRKPGKTAMSAIPTKRIESLPALPTRLENGHKGLFGRLLIVAGSEGMIGAPAFAGAAAFRMGAGLVEVAVPREILSAVLSIEPEMIGLPLTAAGDEDALREAAEKADAIVIGPGLGQSPQAHRRLELLIAMTKPMVVDADGLNMLAAGARWPESFKAAAVLTPHPGEMARLGKLIGPLDRSRR